MKKRLAIYRRFLTGLGALYLGIALFQALEYRNARADADLVFSLWHFYAVLTSAVAGLALWYSKQFGELIFCCAVLSQVAVYIGWSSHLNNQTPLLWVHLCALISYLGVISYLNSRTQAPTA